MTARADGKAAAFMGITGAHLDALFAAPEYFGRGAGALLMREALARGGPLRRRQRTKPRARRFYEKHGFQTTARRETDDCGNPYPILRMELPDERTEATNEHPPRVKNARGMRLISSICFTLDQKLEQIRFVV